MAVNERSPEEKKFQRVIRLLLESALDSLPQGYRTVLMLRDIEGLSASETAECLNLRQESVEVRLLRARTVLRRRLFDRVIHGAPDAFQFLDVRCDRVIKNVLNRLRG
jgi:RNA polymerase sigma-70 factor (ECF subfamily)